MAGKADQRDGNMSRRHEVEQHLLALGDISSIMNAMKTLAYMETRKLTRFLEAQREAVGQMQAVANDFLGHYPFMLAAVRMGPIMDELQTLATAFVEKKSCFGGVAY